MVAGGRSPIGAPHRCRRRVHLSRVCQHVDSVQHQSSRRSTWGTDERGLTHPCCLSQNPLGGPHDMYDSSRQGWACNCLLGCYPHFLLFMTFSLSFWANSFTCSVVAVRPMLAMTVSRFSAAGSSGSGCSSSTCLSFSSCWL